MADRLALRFWRQTGFESRLIAYQLHGCEQVFYISVPQISCL